MSSRTSNMWGRAMANVVPSTLWFSREDWPVVLETNDGLQETYEEWLLAAGAGVAAYERQNGVTVQKILVAPEKLRERHRALGRKIKAQDRAQMAIEFSGREAEGSA